MLARLATPSSGRSATGTFIYLLGGVTLLLWGMRMVRTGVVRALGANLRSVLARSTANRFLALAAGIGVTAILQSSIATILMATSFASRGLMPTTAALAIMLGADLGTTLVAQALSFSVAWLSPLLISIGVILFLTSNLALRRDTGRIAIGLGLILMSLRLILEASEPVREALTRPEISALMASAPLVATFVGVIVTWFAHSSLAIVLLILSLASSGALPVEIAIPMVVGANLGGAIPPILASLAERPEAKRLTFSNAAFKIVGAAVALPFLADIGHFIASIDPDPGRQVVNFHTAFNLALAAAFIFLTGPVAALGSRVWPTKARANDQGEPRYLDRSSLDSPKVALANAARETLRMGDVVEAMVRQSMTALLTDDRKLVAEIERMDNIVDRLDEAIKLYVTKVSRESLDEADGRQATEIIRFTTNLEHIGDIVDKNLMELAEKKIKNKRRFSKEGTEELTALHHRVLENLKLALCIFISGDVEIARRLLEEKIRVRNAEQAAAENHLARLREGRPESIDSSSLHLDVLRDLKRIHSHICSVAYPVLDRAGELRSTRLRQASDPASSNVHTQTLACPES